MSNRSSPIEYLEVPLGGSPRTRAFWLPVIERCKTKVTIWKANYLSFGGRITLIKAVLSHLPIYYPATFKIPKEIAHKLEFMQKQFLERGSLDFKPHLIRWEIVSRTKYKGDLGICGTLKRNIALLVSSKV